MTGMYPLAAMHNSALHICCWGNADTFIRKWNTKEAREERDESENSLQSFIGHLDSDAVLSVRCSYSVS